MRYFLLFAVMLYCSVSSNGQSSESSGVVHQLRIYEIFKGNKDEFHRRFKDHAARIMKKYDFKIIGIWESEKENKLEFVYLLEWTSEQVMKNAWARFMAEKEWSDIKKETSAKYGQMVGEIQDRVLKVMDYSPGKMFDN